MNIMLFVMVLLYGNVIDNEKYKSCSHAYERILVEEGFSESEYVFCGDKLIGYGRNLDVYPMSEKERKIVEMMDKETAHRIFVSYTVLSIDEVLNSRYTYYGKLPHKARSVMIEMVYMNGMAGFSQYKDFLGYASKSKYKHMGYALKNSQMYRRSKLRVERMCKELEECNK